MNYSKDSTGLAQFALVLLKSLEPSSALTMTIERDASGDCYVDIATNSLSEGTETRYCYRGALNTFRLVPTITFQSEKLSEADVERLLAESEEVNGS